MTALWKVADRVLAAVGDRAEAQVRVAAVDSGLTRFANSFIHQHVGEVTVGVDLTATVDGRVASASTTATDDRSLDDLVEAALAMASLSPVDHDWPGLAPPSPATALDNGADDMREVDPSRRSELVAGFIDAGDGSLAAGYVDTDHTTLAYANTAGQRAAGRSSRATVDGIHQAGGAAGFAHQTARSLTALDGAATGARAADLARRSAGAVDIAPGRYPVILSPECVAMCWLMLGWYGFNAKQVQDGQSVVTLGQQQFDAALDVWDDATDPRALGLAFDHEGTPKRRVDLVRGGTSAALVHDRRTARRDGAASTGHAVKGGETWGAFPTNLFVAPGTRSVEELIASVDRGLLLTSFNYVRILDPKTMVATGLTRNGTFLVERGEVRGPVTNLRFTQSFAEAFGPGRVVGVASDARFAGAEEFGSGLVHAPTAHLAEWNFTGGAAG